MASATIIVTKRNIQEREAKASRIRQLLARISNQDPRRFALLKQLQDVSQEIEALKASLHYYKPTIQLGAELGVQKQRIAALRAKITRTVTGSARESYTKQLEDELKKLRRMLAAAKLKTSSTPPPQAPLPSPEPDLSLVPPEGESEVDAAMAAEGLSSDTMDFTALDLPSFDTFDSSLSSGDEKPWYMHPAVLVGAGVAVVLLLKK